MIKKSDLIIWFKTLLDGNTAAGSNVYAWRKTPFVKEEFPYINITADQRTIERADNLGRGARSSDFRIAVVITDEGKEEYEADSADPWIIEKLDDIEEQVTDLLDYDSMPSGGPSGIKHVEMTDTLTERDETNVLVGSRYLIFNIATAENVKRREN